MTVDPKAARAGEGLDPVMRSVPLHYGWVILATDAVGSFMTTPGQTASVPPSFTFRPAPGYPSPVLSWPRMSREKAARAAMPCV